MGNLNESKSLNEIIFENRNKAYGAYTLRKLYHGRVITAFFISSTSAVLLFYIPNFFKVVDNISLTTDLPELPPDTVSIQIIIPQPKELQKFNDNKSADTKVKSVPNAKFYTVEDKQDITERYILTDVPTTTVEDGVENTTLLKGGETDSIRFTESTLIEKTTYNSFESLQRYPQFPGGLNKLQEFLAKKISYPELARIKHISGTILLSFIIDTQGNLTDIKILHGIGGGCEQEAIRALSASPKWTPGLNNDKPVSVLYQIPVKFTPPQY